jgi:hypothetical protein
MQRSIVLLVLVSIVTALLVGCVPNSDRGPIAFTPRDHPYLPQVQPSEQIKLDPEHLVGRRIVQ